MPVVSFSMAISSPRGSSGRWGMVMLTALGVSDSMENSPICPSRFFFLVEETASIILS